MGERWSASAVEGVAPDAASLVAARKLAVPGSWQSEGATDRAVWGLASGSGKNPYQVAVDLEGPAYRCSCPSRKIPCKHVLALLLRWSSGQVPDVDAPDAFAAEWLASRAERAEKAAQRSAQQAPGRADGDGATQGPKDPEAAARRAARRTERVTAGLAELDRWLCDQVRTGLAAHRRDGYAAVEQVAARMVDAQAPGVAGWLRRLPALGTGADWAARLLEQYALLHLLVRAHDRLADLDRDDPAMAATVRSLVGYPVTTEQVLAAPAVADAWVCLAVRRRVEDRLVVQRSWLRGATTGRFALLLGFAPPGQGIEVPVPPGTAVDADVHFHPAARPLRAVVGTRRGSVPVPVLPAGTDVRATLDRFADALADDPWTESLPVRLDDVTLVVPQDDDGPWALRDPAGDLLPLAHRATPAWPVLAVSGGRPVDLCGTWSPDGFDPLAVRLDGTAWWAA